MKGVDISHPLQAETSQITEIIEILTHSQMVIMGVETRAQVPTKTRMEEVTMLVAPVRTTMATILPLRDNKTPGLSGLISMRGTTEIPDQLVDRMMAEMLIGEDPRPGNLRDRTGQVVMCVERMVATPIFMNLSRAMHPLKEDPLRDNLRT